MIINNLLAGGVEPTKNDISNPAFKNSPLNNLFEAPAGTFLTVLLPNAIGLCFVIASVIFLFMIIIGAIQWISSGGDKAGLEAARGKISSAIIGIVILFATFAIIKVIEGFFGVNILTIDIGPLVIQ
ncbi:MAG TPA: hypothetical protein VL401_00020 [Alphaproteobacteria bacterium]|jgi:hypothetical protein|nr:hypothetical protein [Alphaproteobacteria bacterium]